MAKVKKYTLRETLVYVVLWALMFAAPVVSLYVRARHDSLVDFRWIDIFRVWHIYGLYLLAFIIHNFMIAPLLVYRHKKVAYLGGVVCLLLAFTVAQCFRSTDRPHHMGPDRMEMRNNGGPRPDGTHRPPEFGDFDDNDPDGNRRRAMMQEMREHRPPMVIFGLDHIFQLAVAVLILGMNLGVKYYFKTQEDQEKLKELENRSLEQQLRYLKYQINPHFYMNTLNNIHALVDIDPTRAKETILFLSKVMRYVLNEGDRNFIGIGREVDFVQNYIALMKIRYTDRVKITTRFPEQLPDAGIPPLILVTFVENAFKHGVSYKKESFINIAMEVNDGRMKFTCNNSKVKKDEDAEQKGGVGLANARQRLDLIYGNDYTLDIQDGDDTYEVLLLLPLNQPTNDETDSEI